MKSIYLMAAMAAASQAVRLDSSAQEKLYEYMQQAEMEHPVDATLLQGNPYKPRKIYDEDGDGVEDNVEKTYDELDDFYYPNQFGPVDEINNTHHGNLPGHVQLEWDMRKETEPEASKWRLTSASHS